MNTAEENRRQRLALLEHEYGTQVALAEKIGKSPAQISQWKNASRYSGSEKRRAMDRTTARHIERATGRPEGWMDQPVTAANVTPGPDAHERTPLPSALNALIAAFAALPQSARNQLAQDMELLTRAPGDPETKARVLAALQSNQTSIVQKLGHGSAVNTSNFAGKPPVSAQDFVDR